MKAISQLNLFKPSPLKNRIVTFFLQHLYPTVELQKAFATVASAQHLSCNCHWQGNKANAIKKHFHSEQIREIEFYCPKCGTYVGYVSQMVLAERAL